MTDTASALYEGQVIHKRLAPRAHALRYSLFQLLIDLDEAPLLDRSLRWFSYNRWNLFSHFDRDHGDGRAGPLRGYVDELLATAGIDLRGGAVRLLCMPRMLGHVFNPLSIYFCHDADGRLKALLYEVNNTFGQRHSYLIPAAPVSGGEVRQTCAKAFHVSPFMDMAMTYDFVVNTPGETLSTTINARAMDGAPMIHANFTGARRTLDDARLIRAFVAFPLMTLKVVAAIHWEAVKLLAKGLRLRPAPPKPSDLISVAASDRHETIKQSA